MTEADSKRMPPWVGRAIIWFWLGALGAFYAVGLMRALRTLIVVLLVSLFIAFALEPAVNAMARRGTAARPRHRHRLRRGGGRGGGLLGGGGHGARL